MLAAYFDDSGTHGNSNVVVVGGIMGTEWQLASLEAGWRKVLDDPICGMRPPLSRFHMTECQHLTGEFLGWKRIETDFLVHQLQDVMFSAHVAAYGAACSRRDYDELILGDLRTILGMNPEQFCIRNCFVKSLDWAKRNTFDPEIAYVFDKQSPNVERDALVVFDAFEKHSSEPKLCSVRSGSSYKALPLQAADMIAWEVCNHAKDVILLGVSSAKRPQAIRLARNMFFKTQLASRESIGKIAEFWKKEDPDTLKQIADHFVFFDPYG